MFNTDDRLDYKKFFQLSPDMLCLASTDGYFHHVNPAVETILGYTPAEFIAQPWLDLVHPDDRQNTEKILQKQIECSENTLHFQNRYRCKNGEYKWLSWSSTPVIKDNLIYYIARDITPATTTEIEIQNLQENLEQRVQQRTAELEKSNQILQQEITEKKRLEEALLEFTQLQWAILDCANYSIISTDVNGIIQLFNTTAENWLGYSAQEIIGQVTPAIIHDTNEIINHAAILSQEMGIEITPGFEVFVAKARQGIADEKEWTYIRKDGSRFPVLLSVTALYDVEGNITGFLGIGSDITQRKEAEYQLQQMTDELKRSNQELEQFAYIASHDLQEPLRAVTSYAQMLSQRYQGQLDAKADKWIAYIVDGAIRMQNLINDLLAYSRVGTKGKEFQPTDINTILKQTLINLQISIAEKNATITYDNLPLVMADGGQLIQLFQNLIGNGMKFCQENTPKVHISVTENDQEWLFGVKDNGIGINPEYSDRIFLIFQRLHSRREYSGTGIGLAICKRIVERHGGNIWVESQPEKGATFYFTIPKRGI